MSTTGWRISDEARAALHAQLAGPATGRPFAESVLLQVAVRPGAASDPAAELAAAGRVAELLNAAAARDTPRVARALAADPVLLAAFFQNIDLLYEEDDPRAEAVGACVMDALALAADEEPMHPEPGVDGVLETCLYAPDLAAAGRFYEEVIGLQRMSSEPGRHVFFRCGAGMLLLFDPARTREDAGEVPPHGATGPGHVAFSVQPGQLDAWRERLRALGVPVEREVSWPRGGESIYLRDPAGNSVELATPSIWGL